jgi:hypothetical protein
MAILAMCIPILPAKKAKWDEMMTLVSGRMKAAMDASREAAGVHERTFLQSTPDGQHLVLVTIEGDDPAAAFGKLMNDPSIKEFTAMVADIHGFDPSGPPPPMPQLVYDSKA